MKPSRRIDSIGGSRDASGKADLLLPSPSITKRYVLCHLYTNCLLILIMQYRLKRRTTVVDGSDDEDAAYLSHARGSSSKTVSETRFERLVIDVSRFDIIIQPLLVHIEGNGLASKLQ